jgi:hypothetical protein
MRSDGFADLTEVVPLGVRSTRCERDVALADGDSRYRNTCEPVRDWKRTILGAAEGVVLG